MLQHKNVNLIHLTFYLSFGSIKWTYSRKRSLGPFIRFDFLDGVCQYFPEINPQQEDYSHKPNILHLYLVLGCNYPVFSSLCYIDSRSVWAGSVWAESVSLSQEKIYSEV